MYYYTNKLGSKDITITANIPKRNPKIAHSSVFLFLDLAMLWQRMPQTTDRIKYKAFIIRFISTKVILQKIVWVSFCVP